MSYGNNFAFVNLQKLEKYKQSIIVNYTIWLAKVVSKLAFVASFHDNQPSTETNAMVVAYS